jgi:hypothetical protein
MSMKFLSKLKNKFHVHQWDETDQYNQKCMVEGCRCERILKSTRYPKIGEPAIFWKIVDRTPLSEILSKRR